VAVYEVRGGIEFVRKYYRRGQGHGKVRFFSQGQSHTGFSARATTSRGLSQRSSTTPRGSGDTITAAQRLMRSLLSQFQTPTGPRRAVGFFGSGCPTGCPAKLITQSTSDWLISIPWGRGVREISTVRERRKRDQQRCNATAAERFSSRQCGTAPCLGIRLSLDAHATDDKPDSIARISLTPTATRSPCE